MLTAVALMLVVAAGLTRLAAIAYLPPILMFVATVIVLGISMILEDMLIQKYDTPHDEDTHPPALITLRAIRSIIVFAMAVFVFVLAF
jgi:hypothetical protein